MVRPPGIHTSVIDGGSEEFLRQLCDNNANTMRLAQLLKVEAGLDVGEVWYTRDVGHIASVVVCTAPGFTLRDS
jgi:hypothetical protein